LIDGAFPSPKGRSPHRPFSFRGLATAALLALCAAPLIAHFASGHGIADLGDDSVTYLGLARFISGTAGPPLSPWAGLQSHFPPLFPLALAAPTAGARAPSATTKPRVPIA
jgi:hypothetical protein